MMLVNWFSPLPPQRTDIAHFTKRVASELMRCFDVTFWTDLDFDAATLPPGAKIRMFGDGIADRDLRIAVAEGVSFYNLGNDARFHANIADLACHLPGIPIFHDIRLHHLVFERSRHDPIPFSRYIRDTAEQYGAIAGYRAEEISAAQGATIDDFVESAPFTGLFAENAIAAVCHSGWAQKELQALEVPTILLELPFDAPVAAQLHLREWGPPWRLVMYGYMGTNRRVASILEALAEIRPQLRFQLDLYGSLNDEGMIKDIVRHFGLDGLVMIHGFVPEEELDRAISRAHLTFHLRHPTMGETSGGILRSWAFAAPTLVTAAGWFEALPDDVTFKIPVEDEVVHIKRVIDDLSKRPLLFCKKGEAAREYLLAHHGSQSYVEGLRNALGNLADWKKAKFIKLTTKSQQEIQRIFPGSLRTSLARTARNRAVTLWERGDQ